jgi:hypothetical protein
LGNRAEGEEADPETADSDATIRNHGMAAENMAAEIKAGRETTGLVAAVPKAIDSETSEPGNTDCEK